MEGGWEEEEEEEEEVLVDRKGGGGWFMDEEEFDGKRYWSREEGRSVEVEEEEDVVG